MKKIVISAFALGTLLACQPQRTADVVKSELDQVQTELQALELRQGTLQAELDSLSGQKTLRATKVRTLSLEPSAFEHLIEVSGTVEAKNSAYISPETGGQIKAIHVAEGQRVTKGQLLISLNAQAMRSQLAELEGGLKLAETIFEKQKTLWDQKIGSEVQFLEAKNNKESLENRINSVKAQIAMSEIKAPFAGIVDEIYLKVGELSSPGQRLLDLVSLDGVEINAEISEAHLHSVREGDKVQVSFPSLPEANTTASIERKGNIINPANRTVKVVIALANKGGKIKPNQIASVRMRDYQSDTALVVPAQIVGKDIKGDFVFVATQREGKLFAQKTYVGLGHSYNGKTEIGRGLKAGDQIVVEGYNLVRNGSLLELVK